MSTTTQRPTPECDANAFVARKFFNGEYYGLNDVIPLKLGENLERERDEARKQLEAMRSERDQLSRDLSSLLAGDCLDGHDSVEGAQNGIAMREAIREVYRVLENSLFVHQSITTYAPQDAVDKIENQKHCDNMKEALCKLHHFLKP